MLASTDSDADRDLSVGSRLTRRERELGNRCDQRANLFTQNVNQELFAGEGQHGSSHLVARVKAVIDQAVCAQSHQLDRTVFERFADNDDFSIGFIGEIARSDCMACGRYEPMTAKSLGPAPLS
jgi:hypothetical protein